MREELHDVEQVAGMLPVHRSDQLAAIHVLERHHWDFELCVSDAMRTGLTVGA
jgi:hypothetical protein